MSRIRAYLNRRAVRETLFFWFLSYLAIGVYLWPTGVNVPTPEARTSFLHAVGYATLVCVPAYLSYRVLRHYFVIAFPRLAARYNIPLRKF
jgi:hypothetical protein